MNQPAQTRAIWGQYMRRRRRDLKLTGLELADMAGVHRNLISKVEAGTANCSLDNFIAIMQALGCELLFHFESPK